MSSLYNSNTMVNTQPTLWDQPEDHWLPFREARNFARSLGFEYAEEWSDYVEQQPLPAGIPHNPEVIYRFFGWKGYPDWLFAPHARRKYASFRQARDLARCLRLKTSSEWSGFIRDHPPGSRIHGLFLPRLPHLEYKNSGWQGWSDWLGLNIPFKDYETTRRFIKSLNIKSVAEWKSYSAAKRPQHIYAYPEVAYSGRGWQGWDHWFGVELFSKKSKSSPADIPEGATHCRCKGLDENCTDCDGKGYYFPVKPLL